MEAKEALKRLVEGNQRFMKGETHVFQSGFVERLKELAVAGQKPFAVVFSCSDSRAPAEIIFDQGVGDLFMIRVAGNIVAPSLIGSVEFALANLGVKLVVVMGHTGCGAVMATLDSLRGPAQRRSRNISDIISRIRPSLELLLLTPLSEEWIREEAVRTNVRNSVAQLRHGSRLIEDRLSKNDLQIEGAVFELNTGLVRFLDPIEEASDA